MKRQLLIAVLFTWCAAAGQTNIKRVYPFPKDQARVKVIWRTPAENRTEPGIQYQIFVRNYSNSLGWVAFGAGEDTSYIFDRQLADSSALYVTASDSIGNEGATSDTVKVAYRTSAGPQDPPQNPDPSDLPFSDTALTGTYSGGVWKYHGAMGWYARSYDFGTALYMWDQLQPGADYDCYMSRDLRLPAGPVMVTAYCAGYTDADSVDISIGSAKKRVKIVKGTETRPDFFPSSATITVPSTGSYTVKIDPRNPAAIVRVTAVYAAGDTTPPGRVPFVEAVSE